MQAIVDVLLACVALDCVYLLPSVCFNLSQGTVHDVLLKHESVAEVPITKFSYTCKASVKFIHTTLSGLEEIYTTFC